MNDKTSLKGYVAGLARPTRLKRILFYVAGDTAVVFVASLLTYAVATQHLQMGKAAIAIILPYAAAGLACQLAVGFLLASYDLKWSTFALTDVPRAVFPAAVTTVLLGVLAGFRVFTTLTPWSALTWGLLNCSGVLALRGSKRLLEEYFRRKTGKRAILAVCSDKAYALLGVLRRTQGFDYRIIGIVDPDPANRGAVCRGIPVLGAFTDIDRVIARHRVRTAFVLMSSDPGAPTNGLHQQLQELGVEVRTIPSFESLLERQPDSRDTLERLSVHQLTGRAPVTVDPYEMRKVFGGKRILVTGAGGSIGSELCRQLCRFDPEALVLFERDDSNLFYVERGLCGAYPGLDIRPWLGDVTREEHVWRVFEEFRPQVVFHAAAYKHVPILEFHPTEAARVNVLGSHRMARAAVKFGTESFVYISTDKAVNPTSMMGASKRLGETAVVSMNGLGDVRFMAVRFGNVLASRGSVSTVFAESISRRRPIAVTHKDMQRFFMLTSEAVLLVMQAVAIGRGGEVFVLDMGKPILIRELAETMVRNAGLKPYEDIPIVFSGTRPGEKLFEELLTAEEGTSATVNRRIYRARISASHCYPEIHQDLIRLEAAVMGDDPEEVRAEIRRQVANYRPDLGCLKGKPTASGVAERAVMAKVAAAG